MARKCGKESLFALECLCKHLMTVRALEFYAGIGVPVGN